MRTALAALLAVTGIIALPATSSAAKTEPPALTTKWYPEEYDGPDVYIERNQNAGGYIRLRWPSATSTAFSWEWSPTSGGIAFWGECFQDLGVRYVKTKTFVGYREEASARVCIPSAAEYYGD